MITLYNTLSGTLEDVPKKDHINLYTCGPTVYNHAHIGNLRSFIFADTLYRTLKLDGYNPRWGMNITDIDDKTIKGTLQQYGPAATVENLRSFTGHFLDEFLKDLKEVNVSAEEITIVRVTDVIPEIQEFIIGLIAKGYAYIAEDGSTYFSIEKYQADFGDYGSLVGEKFLEGKKTGARVKVDEYDKENLSDFALWKAWTAEDGQIFWDHEKLGRGRPGWHIECSVINNVIFKGEPTDIHTGGVDLLFPHHTNEIAQSQALLGKGNFVSRWFHSEHLLVDGKKMAKRDGNFYTLLDLEDKAPLSPWALRYLFLQTHYRAQQNFTLEALKAASTGITRMITSSRDNENNSSKLSAAALFEDLNTAKCMSESSVASVLRELIGLPLGESASEEALPEQVQALVTERQKAREAKNFPRSDELRKEIEDLGYEVKDTAEGQRVMTKTTKI